MRLFAIATVSLLTGKIGAPSNAADTRAIGRPPDGTGKPSAAALLTSTWIGSLGSALRVNAHIQTALRNHRVLNNAQRTAAPPVPIDAAHPVTIGVFGAEGVDAPAGDIAAAPGAPPLWRDPRWTSGCAVPCRVLSSNMASAHVLLFSGGGSPPPTIGPGARLERWQRKVHVAWAPDTPGAPSASRRLGPMHTLVSYSRYAAVRYDTLPLDEVPSIAPYPSFLGPFGSVLRPAVSMGVPEVFEDAPNDLEDDGILALLADLVHSESTPPRNLAPKRAGAPGGSGDAKGDAPPGDGAGAVGGHGTAAAVPGAGHTSEAVHASAREPVAKSSLGAKEGGEGPERGTERPLVAAWVESCGPEGRGEHYAARYARELARHVRVASLGPCAVSDDIRRTAAKDVQAAFAAYPFVFIGDARIADDYVNPQVLRALAAGAVPVYLGAPNATERLPPAWASRMLVEARHYARPSDLALRLEALANSPADYAAHVEWRKHVTLGDFPRAGSPRALGSASLACRICEHYAAHAGLEEDVGADGDADGDAGREESLEVMVKVRRPPPRTLYRTVTETVNHPAAASTASVTLTSVSVVSSLVRTTHTVTQYATTTVTQYAAGPIDAQTTVPTETQILQFTVQAATVASAPSSLEMSIQVSTWTPTMDTAATASAEGTASQGIEAMSATQGLSAQALKRSAAAAIAALKRNTQKRKANR